MKKILIAIVILCLGGYLYSAVTFVSQGTEKLSVVLISSAILLGINLLCARYLYNKADENKKEWALFGIIGNIPALFIFWFFKDVLTNWKRGKRNFS